MDPRPQEKLNALPKAPGVYLFLDRRGDVIYVGKATNLRARVRSYFQPGRSDERFFISFLDQVLGDIETVVTATEKEALLLENTLIKEHRPRYNVRLRDDKDFLHLQIDTESSWPKLELIRRPGPSKPGVKRFGPYTSARAARSTMLLASRHFRLRTCKDSALRHRTRPCLLYEMDRCPGPCVHPVDRETYLEQVHHATLFLVGRYAELVRELEEKMHQASAELAFERAATYRDQIRAVQATLADQHVVDLSDADQDVFGFAREADMIQFVVLQVREGKITGQKEFHWRGQELPGPDQELLSSVVAQYYEPGVTIPAEILVPRSLEVASALAELLSERRSRRVTLSVPHRGHRAALVRLAQTNAEHSLNQRLRSAESVAETLQQVARRLGLSAPPQVIECVDVAHHQTGRAVAAVAVMENGRLAPSRTKSFTIKTARTGDDYGSLYEVLSRRFRRAKAEEKGWSLPDLLVIDGGRGQLGVAQAALRDVGLPETSVPLVGLAKERPARLTPEEATVQEATVERVYVPGRVNPVTIRGTTPLLLLCQVRDEAHRLAGKLLQGQRKTRALSSALDPLPGVGPKLRRALLRHLGSVKAVQQASEKELATVPGVGPTLARRIRLYFHPEEGSEEPEGRPPA